MNWDAIGAIGELVGSCAVIISLVYLAIQIRQSSESTKALIRQEISDSILNNITGAVQGNENLQKVMHKVLKGHDLDEEEQFRWTVYLYNLLRVHDTAFKQFRSGFLPEEREWLGKFIDSGFIDSFRHLHPEKQEYSWWSYRANARANNKGWRIDYNMVAEPLQEKIKRAVILSEAVHSDHCPILLEIEK